MYDYNEYTISLNEANVYSAYWQPADSLLFNFAADTNHAGKYNFYKYETRARTNRTVRLFMQSLSIAM